jgi:hypothetical protein
MRGKTIPAIAMLALLIVAFTASAVADCGCLAEIAAIETYVNYELVIDCGSEVSVKDSLLFTLGKAVEKHDLGIYDCAVKQLVNFKTKVDALFGAGNISADAYGDLIDLADAAITIIEDSH